MPLHTDFFIWSAFQVFLFLKLASDVVLQGSARSTVGIVEYPEDCRGSKRVAAALPGNSADEKLVRATNLFRNDMENILPFSLIALAAAIVQVDMRIYAILLGLYSLFRISHAFCLISAKQPFRSISYILGQICALALVIMIVVRLVGYFSMS